VLDGVFGLFARPEHVPAEGKYPGSMALECDLEGGLVAAPDLLHERLVADEGEQPLRAERAERGTGRNGGGAHTVRVLPHASGSRRRVGRTTVEPLRSAGVSRV